MTRPLPASRLWPVCLLLAACSGAAPPADRAGAGPVSLPRIQVQPGDWGDADREDIHQVLRSAAQQILPYFPRLELAPLHVSPAGENPIVHFRRGPGGAYRVDLAVRGRLWARFAYQFSHELGHILCDYRDQADPHAWLEETLCEVASLFVLRRMAEAWDRAPPYPNWKSYAPALRAYAQERIEARALPPGQSLAAWLREREPALRANPTRRQDNGRVAVVLLPLFEQAPEHWEAVRWLHGEPGREAPTLREHLRGWRRRVPARHKPFVRRIAQTLGLEPV